ncbi:MAG: hypothetical protein ACJAS2_000116 [Pseudohongiellaceae bacterium]|jgi:hypothetical protein
MLNTIIFRPDWMSLQHLGERIVLKPEYKWEGVNAPIEPSVRNTAYEVVNQLRDPALFVGDMRPTRCMPSLERAASP